jgi:hypothetical protein
VEKPVRYRARFAYNSAMSVNDLRELYSAEPFAPFEIVLTNGATVAVAHPEFMMFSPDYRTVHVADLHDGSTKRIDTKMIIALNERPAPSKRKRNRK